MDGFQRMAAFNGFESAAVIIDEEQVEGLKKYKSICLSGGDWIDTQTLEKLVDYVKSGGTLLWTGVIPKFNDKWEAVSGAINELFPVISGIVPGYKPSTIKFNNGAAFETTHPVCHFHEQSKVTVEASAEIEGKTFACAYSHSLGAGRVLYMGFNPWVWDNWRENAELFRHLVNKYSLQVNASHLKDVDRGQIEVYQHDNRAAGKQFIYVLSRTKENNIFNVGFKNIDGADDSFEIMLTGYSGALVCVKDGYVRSAIVKGINDEKSNSTAPFIRYKGRTTRSNAHGDIFFVCDGNRVVYNFTGPSFPAEVVIPAPSRAHDVMEIKLSAEGAKPAFKYENGEVIFQVEK